MRISLRSQDLPQEILDLMIHQRVTMRVTFDVAELIIDTDTEFDDTVSGDVTQFTIESKRGGGGLDPTVDREIRRLQTRTHGTMG